MNKEDQEKIVSKVLSPEGSLGQLALGAVGLRTWRKIRAEHQASEAKKEKNGQKK